MTRETSYFVQSFNAGKGGSLQADTPIACKSATGATRTAERLALSKLGVDAKEVLDRRFEIGGELAREIGATVLLKGVPTVVSSPDGRRLVVAAGTPVLATGGSGDLLCGIAGTLLAQMDDPLHAAAGAAWIHGRAAELTGPNVRGTTLEEVLEMLPNAWRIPEARPEYPILIELPKVAS